MRRCWLRPSRGRCSSSPHYCAGATGTDTPGLALEARHPRRRHGLHIDTGRLGAPAPGVPVQREHTMSRYAIAPQDPRYEVIVGWDPPMQTYFGQVFLMT